MTTAAAAIEYPHVLLTGSGKLRAAPSWMGMKGFLAQLAERFVHTPAPAKVVFVLDANSRSSDAQQLLEVLTFFDRATDVEFVRGVGEAEFALNEAVGKI